MSDTRLLSLSERARTRLQELVKTGTAGEVDESTSVASPAPLR